MGLRIPFRKHRAYRFGGDQLRHRTTSLVKVSGFRYERGYTVDSDDVVRVTSDSHVERIFTTNFGQVLVCTNSSSFKCFRRKLFIFVRDKMYTQRKLVDTGL